MDLVLGKTAPAARPIDESLEDESEGRGSFNSPDITGHHRDTMMTSNQPDWGAEVKDFREKAVAASPVADEEDTLSYFAKLLRKTSHRRSYICHRGVTHAPLSGV